MFKQRGFIQKVQRIETAYLKRNTDKTCIRVLVVLSISSGPFSVCLLLIAPLHVCYTFCNCPILLAYYVLFICLFLSFVFLFAFQFCQFLVTFTSSSLFLFLAVLSVLRSPWKVCFISARMFLISSFSF